MFALLKLFFVFILVILFLAVFFVIALVSGVLSMFRKAKPGKTSNNGFDSQSSNGNTTGNYTQANPQPSQKKKIIPQDEGEYVDFEEVD